MNISIALFLSSITSILLVVEAHDIEKLYACVSAYPGTDSPVYGKITVRFHRKKDDLKFKYTLMDLGENNDKGGAHIHSGTTCSNATLVGGHYWDKGIDETNPDPWTMANGAKYTVERKREPATGSFYVDNGYGYDENIGHAVVVHANDGSRIGCGILGKEKVRKCRPKEIKNTLKACIRPYPGTKSDVNGRVNVAIDMATNELTYNYYFEDLEKSIMGGTHIHTGTTCNDEDQVGGHYWERGVNETNPDPWTSANGADYSTNQDGIASGNFRVNNGYGYDGNIDHAVVVHDSNGVRVGCGILVDEKDKCAHRNHH